MKQLTNQTPKGTSDWLPEEFSIRKYIFDTWRTVCQSFGYEEYLTPIIESAEIYRAKSGEDVGGKELMTMLDRAGREYALRPEMTPSVTRLVSKIYDKEVKPIRLFSIANFFRNEKPQRGRNREFWQLNYDVFGSSSIVADIEVLQLALELMLAFNPPAESFTLFVNNRKLIDFILNDVAKVTEEQRVNVVRALDKWEKLEREDFIFKLKEYGLNDEQVKNLIKFMESADEDALISNLPELKDNEGFLETKKIMDTLKDLGYGKWVKFQPNIIRGFDYYDGMVFEVADNNPENNRAMFGGGRYNGLAKIFGSNSFPAVGAAPGDETFKIFLNSWGLLNDVKKGSGRTTIYLPILSDSLELEMQKIAKYLRAEKDVILGTEVQKVGKALDFANRKKIDEVLIYGEDEAAKGIYKIKNMESGMEEEFKI